MTPKNRLGEVKHESIQERAEKLAQAIPFVGCGVRRFERTGRAQLEALIRHGLNPWSKLLDIGCGALCGGYWMIHFLDPGCYCGIEPNRRMLEAGLATLLEPEVLELKKPRFSDNVDFDFSVFGEKFDCFFAHSIWTHAPKPQIEVMLNGFRQWSKNNAVFLTSYKPPIPLIRPDHKGARWIGASHESTTPGNIRHSPSWIQRQCEARGLTAVRLRGERIHKQRWIRRL